MILERAERGMAKDECSTGVERGQNVVISEEGAHILHDCKTGRGLGASAEIAADKDVVTRLYHSRGHPHIQYAPNGPMTHDISSHSQERGVPEG
jgi:hypothetical protein